MQDAIITLTFDVYGTLVDVDVNRHGIRTPDRHAKGTPRWRLRRALVQVANRRDPRVTRSAPTSGGTARAGGCLFAHLGKPRGSVSRGS
jgi:hypothetical protein